MRKSLAAITRTHKFLRCAREGVEAVDLGGFTLLPTINHHTHTHLHTHSHTHTHTHMHTHARTHTRGNCILVGSLGQPLESLARFALYIAGYSLQPLDTAKGTIAFSDGLRTLFRQAGLEGKPTAVIVNVRCVHARWS